MMRVVANYYQTDMECKDNEYNPYAIKQRILKPARDYFPRKVPSRPRASRLHKFKSPHQPHTSPLRSIKHGRFKERGLNIQNHKNSHHRQNNHRQHRKCSKKAKKNQQKKQKKQSENSEVREHINYFGCAQSEIPSNLLPYVLDTGNYSNSFYYEDTHNQKSILFAVSGDFFEDGQPRFVYIYKYDVATDSLTKLQTLPCCQYFSQSPMIAIDRDHHILHLFGNYNVDRHKLLSFDLRTNQILRFGKVSKHELTQQISMQFLIDFGYDKSLKCTQSLNRLSSDIILKEKWPISNYKRYLFVPSLQILLRFGGEHGVNDLIEYVDIEQIIKSKSKICKNWNRSKVKNKCVFGRNCWFKHGENDENKVGKVKWRKYANIRLPGSALSMHFVIGYDHFLYVFDVKGGGNGKIWIIDLLFSGNRMERALKSMDAEWFRWDFVAKITQNYVRFINASRYGELLISLSDIMPSSMIRYYDDKSKALINGYCREVVNRHTLSSNFHICLIGVIYSFFQPFF